MDTQNAQQYFECAVCGASAKGFHFGAFTCEGCKSFFGRASLRKERALFCRLGGACNVQGENRTACKACRYEKCLRVGMSPMNSRFGRRSKYFKVSAALSFPRAGITKLEHTVENATKIESKSRKASHANVDDRSLTTIGPNLSSNLELGLGFVYPGSHTSCSSIFPPLFTYQHQLQLYFARLLLSSISISSISSISPFSQFETLS
ncbi:unnamed protein product, partial [Mesorhabditis belari]|uniref:Nuclear receptor domain-containing protein n=1 Tax=Mesorhabditis belari TaxID=2138241 RepID=A0AAF3J6Z3_9BILA